MPEGEINDEIEHRTKLNNHQRSKLKNSKIKLVYYLAFDEGIDKIVQQCERELSLDIEVKRYLPTNTNESAFGDPSYQEAIRQGFREIINSGSSAFIGYKTESLTVFYNLLVSVGCELNKCNKPNWDQKKINERSLGYGNLGRLLVTDYNIPTISITALWQHGNITIKGKSIEWKALVPRKEKKLGPSLANLDLSIEKKFAQITTTELVDFENDERDLKGHNDILKILKLYRPNSKFTEVLKGENKGKKIGYIILQEHDDVYRKVNYFMYLFQGISLTPTYEEIKAKIISTSIKFDKNLIVLLPKEKHQIKIEQRKESVNKLFNPLSIFYIDDFIRDKCTPSEYFTKASIKFLDNKNFVTPTIRSEFYNEVNLESVKAWVDSENEPILVVKGVGGIGKTTLAEFASDLFKQNKTVSKVIFIDSHEIIEKLLQTDKFNEDIDLYKIYEADIEVSPERQFKLSQDQLKYNLDIGNILIVIDGLDEVISRIPKFDVDKFLESIFRFTEESGSGKVLISCRSFFWQTSKYSSSQILSIEILPFNTSQAREFFEKCFTKDLSNVRKAITIANKLLVTSENGEKYYHPYVLDIIKNLIETEKDLPTDDMSIESKLLDKSVRYDLIIYEVCYRESKRILKDFNIDNQVKFFIELAVDNKGSIAECVFHEYVQKIVSNHIDKSSIEALKSHPFMQVQEGTVKFRYDFFTQYFVSHYISSYIKYENEVYTTADEDFIRILVEDCWFNSGTVNDIKDRVKNWVEEDYLKIIDLMSQIRQNQPVEKDMQRKAISHLFYIALALNHKFFSNDINSNTNLVTTLFQTPNKMIEGLCLINFNSKKDNIRFDFRSLTFNDAYIDNFESFWLCPADDKTTFKNSTLINLNFVELLKSSISRQNFRDCIFNEEIDDFYRQKQILKGENLNLQIRHYFEDFLKLFLIRGKVERQSAEKINAFLKSEKYQLIEETKFIELLKEKRVLQTFVDIDGLQYKISEDYRQDVKSFLRNGMMTNNLTQIISGIKRIIL